MVVLPVNFSGSIYAHSGSMRPADGQFVMVQPVSISMLAKVLTIVKSRRSRMVTPFAIAQPTLHRLHVSSLRQIEQHVYQNM